MDVQIGTLTSRVTVADDSAGAGPELIEKVVALVLARLREEEGSHESTKREQEIHPHMLP